MNRYQSLIAIILFFFLFGCNSKSQHIQNDSILQDTVSNVKEKLALPGNENFKTIHVFVPLCDNVHQGIVKVPALVGNGDDPDNNLYWGAIYGVRNYFDKLSADWMLVKTIDHPNDKVLERLLFKHSAKNVYLLADGYQGKHIEQTIKDFLWSAAGEYTKEIKVDSLSLHFAGSSDLLAYIEHNGLMDLIDFSFIKGLTPPKGEPIDVIIISCFSMQYFHPIIKNVNANPIIWTNGLLGAEAYTLEWALDGWVLGENGKSVMERGKKGYAHYQKKQAHIFDYLFSTGWGDE